MALRDWSTRRILSMWLIGIGAELVLLAGTAAYSRLTESPRERELRLWADRSRRQWQAYEDSVARGLERPPQAITPAQKAAIQALLRDSLGVTWETHGNVTTIKGPPAFDSAVRRATTNLGNALLLAAVLYLSIPIVLVGVTVSWLIERRPWQHRPAVDAPAG